MESYYAGLTLVIVGAGMLLGGLTGSKSEKME